MTEFSSALGVSASGLRAQTQRLRHVAENIANAETPGYQRKLVAFEPDQGKVAVGPVELDDSPREQIYDPAHPLADAAGYYQGTNVDMMVEIADAREAQRSYEANLKMFEQTRSMQASLLELLRR